jgi:choline dehydrogenase-like flavoprotein
MPSADYVVVGGGTAGSVLAARLSEDPGVRVVLIEAGPAQPLPAMRDPGAWPRLAGSEVDWNFRSVPQRGLDGAVLPITRGRVLGGSSGINALMHMRGDRSSYDVWQDDAWGYDALLPYFKRSERVPGGDPDYRGTDGPMLIEPVPVSAPLWQACFQAAVDAGYPANPDGNAAHAEGTSWNDNNIVDGLRQSAADAYLSPAAARPNLTVIADAQVRRLVISGSTCHGVEYVGPDGQVEVVDADREVLLTAGAIGSPHLLMVSGIGPARHLREHGVDVVADLPGVGANLQDHPLSQAVFRTSAPVRPAGFARKPHVLLRTGLSDDPDIQIIFNERPLRARFTPGPENGYSVVFSLMTPISRGTVRLAGADPARAPLIDPNYLADEHDVNRMIAGLEVARAIGSQRALSPMWEVDPGEPRAFLRASAAGYFHASGTCRIGRDGLAVVDSHLQVHGIGGLRVADASVMPSIVSANTNATVLAIAERAAAVIIGR